MENTKNCKRYVFYSPEFTPLLFRLLKRKKNLLNNDVSSVLFSFPVLAWGYVNLLLELKDQTLHIRLAGIDSPEVFISPIF